MLVSAKYIEDKQTFRPFTITIPVDSIEAARALYAIFDYGPNFDLLFATNLSAYVIKNLIDEYCGENNPYVENEDDVIASGITYKKFYRR